MKSKSLFFWGGAAVLAGLIALSGQTPPKSVNASPENYRDLMAERMIEMGTLEGEHASQRITLEAAAKSQAEGDRFRIEALERQLETLQGTLDKLQAAHLPPAPEGGDFRKKPAEPADSPKPMDNSGPPKPAGGRWVEKQQQYRWGFRGRNVGTTVRVWQPDQAATPPSAPQTFTTSQGSFCTSCGGRR